MIPEIDIWRRHPDDQALWKQTLDESIARADELAAQGDYNGQAVWRRITEAVTQLANMMPSGALH